MKHTITLEIETSSYHGTSIETKQNLFVALTEWCQAQGIKVIALDIQTQDLEAQSMMRWAYHGIADDFMQAALSEWNG